MDRFIMYGRPDGGVSIVIPCRCIEDDHLSDEQILYRAWVKLPPDAIDPKIVVSSDIPQDRTFRGAWEHGGGKVAVNMDKAREIHLDRIRAQRNAVLAALDVETVKALGKGDALTSEAIEAQKQVLRDIPQTIDLTVARTPEELKNIWPVELN